VTAVDNQKINDMNWAGIDYGSKLAGTTCITLLSDQTFHTLQSKKGADADQWLESVVREYGIKKIFIDAPLSLPAAYFDASADDFFYRKADRALSAMSPMFLGGLTARAMRLKRTWMLHGVVVYETYPAALSKELNLVQYKNDISLFTKELMALKGFNENALPDIQNWHQVDSLLAWYSGWRMENQLANVIGDQEGTIIV
jgi:predicted nuclease with RNAse H fold